MGINLVSPSATTSAMLIYDAGIDGGPPDSVAQMTQVANVTVNAALEVKSITGTILFPRMTTTQKNALTTVVDGMAMYDSTLAAWQFRQGGAWLPLGDQQGGTFVAAVGSATVPSYTFTGDLTTGIYHSAANTIDFSTGGTRQFNITNTPSAVNYIEVTGAETGTNPILSASGNDMNVGLDMIFKGTGILNLKQGGTNGTIAFWNSGFYTALSSLNPTANITYTLPDTLPTVGQTPVTCDVFGHLTTNSIGPIIYTQTTSIDVNTIRTLFSTPHVLIGAPGVGNVIIINRATFKLKKGGTTVYTNTGTGSLAIRFQYGTAGISAPTQATVDVSANLFLTSTVSSMTSTDGTMVESSDASNGNQPISVAIDGSDMTGGNAGDTLVCDIWYSVVNLNV